MKRHAILQTIKNLKLADVSLLMTLAHICFWVPWPGWQEIQWIFAFSLFAAYFFDRHEMKLPTWMTVATYWSYFLALQIDSNQFPYGITFSAFFISGLWIYFNSDGHKRLSFFWDSYLAVTSLLGAMLFSGFLEKSLELKIFVAFMLVNTLLPFVVNVQTVNKQVTKNLLPVVSYQQIVLRLSFILWLQLNYHEIRVLQLIENFDLFMISGMVFLPFYSILNRKHSDWSYLFESYLSLMVVYSVMFFNSPIIKMAAALSCFSLFIALNRWNRRSDEVRYRTLKLLERGGFGGIYFLILLSMILAAHKTEGFLQLTLLLLVLFSFAIASARQGLNEQHKAHTLSHQELVTRWLAQLLALALFFGVVAS